MNKNLFFFTLSCISLFLVLTCSTEHKCIPDNSTQALWGENISLAKEIADKWISQKSPESLAWNWEPAVLMFAITKLYSYTGEVKYLKYYKDWIDYYIEGGYYLMMSDQVIPSAMAAELYRRTCDEKYINIINEIYIYLTEESPRTIEGGISHLGTIAPTSPQLWIDSLFMFGIPLVEAFRATGEKKYINLLIDQIIIFSDILQEDNTGFFRHAWINQQLVPQEPVFWARGNGWVIVALTELLSVAGEFKEKKKLRAIYDLLRKSIIESQDAESGLWWTVLNRPGETYLETSGSALFTYSIFKGINENLIDSELYLPYAKRGIDGIKKKIILEDGLPVVTGVSKGTGPGDFDNYNSVEIANDVPYGIGSVILSLVEAQRYQ